MKEKSTKRKENETEKEKGFEFPIKKNKKNNFERKLEYYKSYFDKYSQVNCLWDQTEEELRLMLQIITEENKEFLLEMLEKKRVGWIEVALTISCLECKKGMIEIFSESLSSNGILYCSCFSGNKEIVDHVIENLEADDWDSGLLG